MQDKTSIGISDLLLQFIEALVEEVVINGESFDAQKKWLRKNSEAEGVSYETIESNLNDLFEAIKELEGNESKYIERSVRALAKECYLSEALVNKLIDNATTRRRQKVAAERREREDRDRKAQEEAERKVREEQDRIVREKAQLQKRLEAERKAKEEAEHIALAAELARKEAERKAQEEKKRIAERKAEEERERKTREEKKRDVLDELLEEAFQRSKQLDAKIKELEEKVRQKEVREQKNREETERKAKDEAERKAREERDRIAKEKAEKKAREERERKAMEEAMVRARMDAGDASNFIFVEGGSIYMRGEGFKEAQFPTHLTQVSSFHISKYVVTQQQWKNIMGYYSAKGSLYEYCLGDRLPAVVKWDDLKEFIQKISQLKGKRFQLPYEWEWDYAASGGIYTRKYKYCGSNNYDEVAWRSGEIPIRLKEIGQKKPNELGLYDMSGNVEEWCIGIGLVPNGIFYGVLKGSPGYDSPDNSDGIECNGDGFKSIWAREFASHEETMASFRLCYY